MEPADDQDLPPRPDVGALVATLHRDRQRLFEELAVELTKISIWRAKILGDRSHFPELMLLNGHIEGVATAMCFLLRLPRGEAHKEMAIDRYMVKRWEQSNWEGWPK